MRCSDMDAYGHVNNVIFLGYFEMARVDLFFERASLEERTGLRRGTVVAEHSIRYKLPVVYWAEPPAPEKAPGRLPAGAARRADLGVRRASGRVHLPLRGLRPREARGHRE